MFIAFYAAGLDRGSRKKEKGCGVPQEPRTPNSKVGTGRLRPDEDVAGIVGVWLNRAAIGRGNWLHIGGDGGLKTASVLSGCASATRHPLDPLSYLRDVLDQLAGQSGGGEVGDLLPDAWAVRHNRTG